MVRVKPSARGGEKAPAERQPTMALRDVTYTYADGTEALSEVTLDIYPREITVVFGPARAGKTTLLRLLNRLSDLSLGARHEGQVLVSGQDIFAPERGRQCAPPQGQHGVRDPDAPCQARSGRTSLTGCSWPG